jgi:adenylate cyclase
MAYTYVGEPEQAIAYADKAMRLSPHDPVSTPTLYLAKAIAFGILQDYEEALVWIERAQAAAPEMLLLGFVRPALLALAGREVDARATMERYLASDNAPIRTITQWKARWQGIPSSTSPRFLTWGQKFNEGLRKAGMPE